MANDEEHGYIVMEEEEEEGVPAVDENLMYDPDQDLEERRAIRKGYRKLQEDGTYEAHLFLHEMTR